MRFIDLESAHTIRRVAILELILLLLGRVPKSSVVNRGDVEILSDPCKPSGDAIDRHSRRKSHGDLDH